MSRTYLATVKHGVHDRRTDTFSSTGGFVFTHVNETAHASALSQWEDQRSSFSCMCMNILLQPWKNQMKIIKVLSKPQGFDFYFLLTQGPIWPRLTWNVPCSPGWPSWPPALLPTPQCWDSKNVSPYPFCTVSQSTKGFVWSRQVLFHLNRVTCPEPYI